MSSDLAQLVLDAVYEELGAAARFTPAEGVAKDVLVLPDKGDGSYQSFGVNVVAERTRFLLRASEAADPKKGDRLTFPRTGGVDYEISSAPRREDPDQIEWTLELVEADDA